MYNFEICTIWITEDINILGTKDVNLALVLDEYTGLG